MSPRQAEQLGTPAEPGTKLFYRIGEVRDLTGIQPYVLRYWESEFKLLRPRKNQAGQRVYKRRDIDLVLKIKLFLYEERLTLEGAKKRLALETKPKGRQLEFNMRELHMAGVLKKVRGRLERLRERLRQRRPGQVP